jgi:hypothetical protein
LTLTIGSCRTWHLAWDSVLIHCCVRKVCGYIASRQGAGIVSSGVGGLRAACDRSGNRVVVVDVDAILNIKIVQAKIDQIASASIVVFMIRVQPFITVANQL